MKKSTERIIIIFIAMVSVTVLYFYNIHKNNIQTTNTNNRMYLAKRIEIFKNHDIVSINDLVNFDWDCMYIYEPYSINKSQLEKEVGKVSGLDFVEPSYDTANCVVFTKDGQPICGLFKGLDFQISFDYNKNGHKKIVYRDDNAKFRVQQVENSNFIKLVLLETD